jgi:hypothetical protein
MKTANKNVPKPEADASESGQVNLIYKIEGKPQEVGVFELARVLDSFGNVLRESYRIVSEPNAGEMVVKVKPFESGSFIMDLALRVQQNPEYLFLLSQVQVLQHAKAALEYLGYIKKTKDFGANLFELIKALKDGRPEKIEQTAPDRYEYHAKDGAIIPVNSSVNALYNNSVINNFTFNIVAPAENETAKGILTYLKGAERQTSVRISKQDVQAVRAYTEPPELTTKVEVLEDTTTKMLNPKSGNYGQTTGTWNFTIAGTHRSIKARIVHKEFLKKYSDGSIRFYQGDRLKVRLRERQVIEGEKTRMEYEIVEVLDYHQATQNPVHD